MHSFDNARSFYSRDYRKNLSHYHGISVYHDGRNSVYHYQHPDDYQYSQFCKRYRDWAKKLDVVMRQEHRSGGKLFPLSVTNPTNIDFVPFSLPFLVEGRRVGCENNNTFFQICSAIDQPSRGQPEEVLLGF
jgi:hypothetical protein